MRGANPKFGPVPTPISTSSWAEISSKSLALTAEMASDHVKIVNTNRINKEHGNTFVIIHRCVHSGCDVLVI